MGLSPTHSFPNYPLWKCQTSAGCPQYPNISTVPSPTADWCPLDKIHFLISLTTNQMNQKQNSRMKKKMHYKTSSQQLLDWLLSLIIHIKVPLYWIDGNWELPTVQDSTWESEALSVFGAAQAWSLTGKGSKVAESTSNAGNLDFWVELRQAKESGWNQFWKSSFH